MAEGPSFISDALATPLIVWVTLVSVVGPFVASSDLCLTASLAALGVFLVVAARDHLQMLRYTRSRRGRRG